MDIPQCSMYNSIIRQPGLTRVVGCVCRLSESLLFTSRSFVEDIPVGRSISHEIREMEERMNEKMYSGSLRVNM